MSAPRHIPLIVLGVGNVGRAFLAQLMQTRQKLVDRYDVDLQPVALADSRSAVMNTEGLSPNAVEAVITAKKNGQSLAGQPGSLGSITAHDLVAHAAEAGLQHAIVIDTTAADGMEQALSAALNQGYGLVLANKRPLAGSWETTRHFFASTRVRFEATVGAGLPVNSTLRYLIDTGDTVYRIEGALSGTLGYLCSRLEDGEAFSSVVTTAKERGYTEPDPRDDLSGMDVARKALILGRLAGWPMELKDLRVDPLYPDEMADITVEAFMAQLPDLDTAFAAYMGSLAGVPRYMAEITPDGGVVSFKMVGERLAAELRGTRNQVSFTTQRYADMPLTLLGPGGGMDVTAAAVLQDCLYLAHSMC
ncbi:MAG: homoserine dehydrogenase [Anaerolineae bacterium]|nr:homoserine dehydrogenase [Anaerolineae bacterium]